MNKTDKGNGMERFVDLHTHSLQSDGTLTPAELVREAKKAGLAAVALSDHDTIDGVREAMAEGEKIGIEVIPAVEFSVKSKTTTHIVALYPDIENEEFVDMLEGLRLSRLERNAETARLLQKLGIDVTLEEVMEMAGGKVIGRAHFAKALADKGYTSSVKESFNLYLGNGKPAYSHAFHPTAEAIIKLIRRAGGVSIMAHLNQTNLEDDELRKTLIEFKEYGLDGVEGYYTEYTPEMQEKYQTMAKELGLILSGGSDFHGSIKPHISIGTGTGNLRVPYAVLENIKNLKENR